MSVRTWSRSGHHWPKCAAHTNAITVEGNAVGRLLFHGLGAGQMPTASACARRHDRHGQRSGEDYVPHLELWKQQPAPFTPSDFTQASGKFYLRFSVADKPGVMAEITSILANIRSRSRRSFNTKRPMPTAQFAGDHDPHDDRRCCDPAAFNQIAKLSSMKSPAVKMRVLA